MSFDSFNSYPFSSSSFWYSFTCFSFSTRGCPATNSPSKQNKQKEKKDSEEYIYILYFVFPSFHHSLTHSIVGFSLFYCCWRHQKLLGSQPGSLGQCPPSFGHRQFYIPTMYKSIPVYLYKSSYIHNTQNRETVESIHSRLYCSLHFVVIINVIYSRGKITFWLISIVLSNTTRNSLKKDIRQ